MNKYSTNSIGKIIDKPTLTSMKTSRPTSSCGQLSCDNGTSLALCRQLKRTTGDAQETRTDKNPILNVSKMRALTGETSTFSPTDSYQNI